MTGQGEGPRILAVTLGTRGDVAPFAHLGAHLAARGYRYTLAAQAGFAHLAEAHGLDFLSLGDGLEGLIEDPVFAGMSHGGGRAILAAAPAVRRFRAALVEAPLARVDAAAPGFDLVICHALAYFALSAAEAHGKPAILVPLQPVAPTGRAALPLFSRADYGALGNRLTHLAPRLAALFLGGAVNAYRRKRGLRPQGRLSHPLRPGATRIAHAYASALSPPAPDWGPLTGVAGLISTPEEAWTPNPQLARYLDRGAPVYIGFGSLPCLDRAAARAIVEGVRLWGGRALLAQRLARLAPRPLPRGVRPVGHAPHDALFRHVSAVMHHGGAGTTHTGLMAGRPTFVAPIVADNHYWGARVFAAGAGPRPIWLKRLTPGDVAETLADLTTNPAYREAAAALGPRIRAERGEDAIAALIEEMLARPPAAQ